MRTWLQRIRKLRERRLVRWTLDALLVLAVLFAVTAWQTRHHARGDAPDFALPTLEGGVVTKRDLAGKPTLLVFWAPWCTVCRLESANISRVRDLVGERANVVSIASSYEDVAAVRRYVEERAVDYPVLLGGAEVARDYRVSVFPTVYFLDDEGRISGSVVGYTTTAGLLWRLWF